MKKDNKEIYNRIMESVSREVKKVLNEEKELTPDEKMDAWHNGERDENIKACGADKLKSYKAICKAKGYDAEVAALDAEIKKRGLKESVSPENMSSLRELADRIQASGEIDSDKDSQIVFDALVPASGASDNLGGEIMRAAMRIAYRYWNDGDIAGEGYGRETVNPAVRFLNARVRKASSLRTIIDQLMHFVDRAYCDITDKEYERLTQNLLAEATRYIVTNVLWNMPNNEDMWDFRDKQADVDRDEDWEDEGW